MCDVLARLFDVVHAIACAASSTVLPLLNNAQLKNMLAIVVTPVMSARLNVWLNAPHSANIWLMSVSVLVVGHVIGFDPASAVFPLLKSAAF